MNNHMTARKALLIIALVAVSLISIVGIKATAARFSSAAQRAANVGASDREIRDALRRGGLREAAKLKGHYVGDFDPHWDFGLFDIEALTKNSTAVVLGTVTKRLGTRLSDGDQLIFTDYEVVVSETVKGGLTKTRAITIALPGGRVDFEDGTSAELRTPDFEHVAVGSVCALFLTENANGLSEYTLTGGPQGLVEIMGDATLKSHGRDTDPIAQEIKDANKGRDRATFLKEMRKQAVKWPAPGKCCS